ncbi:hypothetical protein HBI83_221610 [Parastagonospora nodorum]|nr:hypothetical protein HBI83_221610 [Parastagonospora nodorum]
MPMKSTPAPVLKTRIPRCLRLLLVLPLSSYSRRVPGMNSYSPCSGALLRWRILEADMSGSYDTGLTLPASLYLAGQHVAEGNGAQRAWAARDEEFVVIVLSSEMMQRLETRRATRAKRLLTL